VDVSCLQFGSSLEFNACGQVRVKESVVVLVLGLLRVKKKGPKSVSYWSL